MPDNSHLFSRPPRWLNQRAGLKQQFPKVVQSWFFESGSLTERLRRQFAGRINVNVLLNQWRKATVNEQQALQLPTAQFSLIREVLLHSEGKPLILARSIIPQATIHCAHRNLSHLGTRPLGEVIFAYPDLQRLNLQFTRVPTSYWHTTPKKHYPLDEPIWGRRTVYAIPTQPLIVSEFFMPELLALSE